MAESNLKISPRESLSLLNPLPVDVLPRAPAGATPYVFLPLERHPSFRTHGTDRGNEWVAIHGRLAPGVSVAQASAAVSAVTSSLARQYPSTNENKAGIAAPYDAFGNLGKSRIAVIQVVGLTLTGMVLLVLCLNISGMVQVRSAMRERELSIRQAIGATRRQLIQYMLSEAIIMAGLGAFLASLVLFNLPSLRSLLTNDPLPPEVNQALRVNLPTVGFCVGLCFLILFDVVKLVLPGVVVGLILTAAFIRLRGEEKMGIPLSSVEYLSYIVGAAVAVLIAVVANLAPARRAASVQPMVAMRSE
jgi:ABC-type antimicrobial peptide transport system permease subunit